MSEDWYEVWGDNTLFPPYILILCPNRDNPMEFLIFDPKDDNRIVFRTTSYEEATLYLSEDEFLFVDGRMHS